MSADSCIRFLVELVKSTWTGEIGTRQAGCINNSVRTMLSYYLNDKMPHSQFMIEPEHYRRPIGVKIVEEKSGMQLMKEAKEDEEE
jgi:hypothetical protein